jgi:hypothetical protein
MKIKLQLNGESNFGVEAREMNDSEYNIEMEIDNNNLNTLISVLERVIEKSNNEFFNWNIIEINN